MTQPQDPEVLRAKIEYDISGRLRLSRWLQRGILAAAIAAGLNLSYSPVIDEQKLAEQRYNPPGFQWDDWLSISALIAALPVTMMERDRSKRHCHALVGFYRAATGSSNEGLINTTLKIKDGYLIEETKYDDKANDEYWRTLPVLSPALGGLSAFMLASAHLSEIAHGSDAVMANVTGVPLVALAVAGIIRDTPRFDGRMESYERRLDNIDGGICFE